MSLARRARIALILVALMAFFAPVREARADQAADDARVAFREGAALIEQAEWATALGAFERSLALRPHALTLYNIGVCQRFLGRATLAQQTLRKALTRAESSGEMPALFLDQTRAYIAEVEAKLAHLTIRVTPRTTRVAVDGRALVPADQPGVFVAGVAEPGEAKPAGAEVLDVIVDPRAIVLTFSLDGHDTIEIRKDVKPGSREEVPVSMTEQPAQIRIASSVVGSIVRVDGVDVGIAPVVVSRPPGERLVSISSAGFVPYESKLTLRAGQLVPLDAQLLPEKTPITKKWWFWTGSAVLLAGVGVATYFLVRPTPQRPDTDRGGLGWAAEVQ